MLVRLPTLAWGAGKHLARRDRDLTLTKPMKTVIGIICLMALAGCEDPAITHVGNSAILTLACNQKLVTAEYNTAGLIYLTRDMREGEMPEISTLHHHEDGIYRILESRCSVPASVPSSGNCPTR